jgi:hypothetical protein
MADNSAVREGVAGFTPGPWGVSTFHNPPSWGGDRPCVVAGGATIAVVSVAPITPRPEADANAALIATTPDLLAYLEQAIAEVDCLVEAARPDLSTSRGKGMYKNRAWLRAMDAFLAESRAVCRKARGRTNDTPTSISEPIPGDPYGPTDSVPTEGPGRDS